MNSNQKKFHVILHNIRSCYNVGSIFRSADAFGITKIFLGGYTPNPSKDKAIYKTALGAEKSVDWEASWHTYALIERLKKAGFKVVALEQSPRSKNIQKFRPKFPCALIVGNEVKGLSSSMLSRCDQVIEIPMLGEKESLNVSVAFGIAAHYISSKFKVQN